MKDRGRARRKERKKGRRESRRGVIGRGEGEGERGRVRQSFALSFPAL